MFLNRRGGALSRFGVRYLLAKYVRIAEAGTPTMMNKRIHPHVLRHTTAVHLLHAGVDIVTVSHWLGHASIETTNRYAAVDLEMKRRAIAKAEPVLDNGTLKDWRADTTLLSWLHAL